MAVTALRRSVSLALIAAMTTMGWSAPAPVAAQDKLLSAASYMVVDCLLPGQVRKLGGQATFMTPRRPTRTSAVNCEIRGGEYVAADRADFASSLAVWLPSAKGGDAKAQAYVGRIYADGLGQAPDFAQAATWYQKAADQGYAQAMIDLGQLYERGQGVPKDPVKAVNLYRKASGLPPANFASPQSALSGPDPALADLKRQLDEARQDLAAARDELAKAKAAPPPAAKPAPAPKAAPSAAAAKPADMAAVQKQLADKNAQLDAANARAAQLTAQLAKAKADADAKAAPLAAKLQAVQTEHAQTLAQRDQMQRDLTTLRSGDQDAAAKLAKAQADYDRVAHQLAQSQTAAAAGKSDSAQTQKALQSREADLAAARAQATAAEAKLAKAQADLADRETRLKASETRLAQAQQQVTAVRSDSAQRTAPLEQQLATLQASSKATQAQVGQLQHDYDSAVQRNAELSTKVATLEQQVAQSKQSGAAASKDLAAREAQLAAREARVKELETKLASAGGGAASGPLTTRSIPKSTRLPFSAKLGLGLNYAILIGESNYTASKQLPKLITPRNDVSQLGALLQSRYGFNVTVLLDKSRAEILRELDTASMKLGENDTLIIYYAGHGGMEKVRNGGDRGYWLPVDAQPGSSAEQISNQEITYQVARMAARKVLIIADSCYSGLLTQTVSRAQRPADADERTGDYLIGMAHKQSRNVLTSGGLEPVLDGGGAKDHSVFAAALLDILNRNNDVMTSEELYNQLVTRVVANATTALMRQKDTPDPQAPKYSALDNSGHVYGDFLFVPKTRLATAQGAQAARTIGGR